MQVQILEFSDDQVACQSKNQFQVLLTMLISGVVNYECLFSQLF